MAFFTIVLSFNSTLVRLEEPLKTDFTQYKKFQFHFGSIGSIIVAQDFRVIDVSIPLWFDWKQF